MTTLPCTAGWTKTRRDDEISDIIFIRIGTSFFHVVFPFFRYVVVGGSTPPIVGLGGGTNVVSQQRHRRKRRRNKLRAEEIAGNFDDDVTLPSSGYVSFPGPEESRWQQESQQREIRCFEYLRSIPVSGLSIGHNTCQQ